MRRPLPFILLLFLSFLSASRAITVRDLFPFGRDNGDDSLYAGTDGGAEDVSSAEIQLGTNVRFFGRDYGAIYVNENGLLSFLTEIPSFFNVQFPLDYPLLAALYSDVDCRESGEVWYRATSAEAVANLASDWVEAAGFSRAFSPAEVFVATWEKVGYFDAKGDKVNTFQLAVASDGESSYAIFLYPEAGIEWIRGEGKNGNMGDARAQAGIISGEGINFIFSESGSDQVRNLDAWSNMNEAGVYVFKIGGRDVDVAGAVIQPDVDPLKRYTPGLADDCRSGSKTCHSRATCHDDEAGEESGFCCRCLDGYLGDGRTCLPATEPRRVSGSVSGNVNSVTFTEQDLHCYVVTEDGRTYTAISRIPPSIGTAMQALAPIGTPIAWLFARRMGEGARNGFDITGGVFNYTARVKFLGSNSGKSAVVKFRFKGIDAFDYLKVEGTVQGTIPPLAGRDSEVELSDYSEDFTEVRPGLITSSSSSRSIAVKGGRKYPFEVTHTIEYLADGGCGGGGEPRGGAKTRFKSTRNYIVYDGGEEVVRYAMTSKVIPLTGSGDGASATNPCLEMRCGADSYCVARADGGGAECICSPGFEKEEDGRCGDVDECAERTYDCSPHADCVNQVGTFGCACREGYVGDGKVCIEVLSCSGLGCSENAECVVDAYDEPSCACLQGFEGDGTACTPVPSRVKMAGYSKPEEVVYASGGGEVIRHFYEVSNLGPQTIGGVELRVAWPTEDEAGRAVSALEGVPFVRYKGPTADYTDECEIKKSLRRRRRRESDDSEYIDDEYDADEEMERRIEEYEAELSEEELQRLKEYDQLIEDYDYSHFDAYNDPAHDDYMAKADPVSGGLEIGPGETEIVCRVSLAAGESCIVTISAKLETSTLEDNYKNVAEFSYPSRAAITERAGMFTMVGGTSKASAATRVRPREPRAPPRPGVGAECGGGGGGGAGAADGEKATCSRYADCHRSFASSGGGGERCYCVVGFKGDGVECEPTTEEDSAKDCREIRGRCGAMTGAECAFSDASGVFECRCGGGGLCAPIDGETSTKCNSDEDCSPFADCRPGGVCACFEGYEGDGLLCREHRDDGDGGVGDDEREETEDLCKSDSDCGRQDPNSECRFDAASALRKCACKPFYVLDSSFGSCVPGPDAGCDIKDDCDTEHGKCVSDPAATGGHRCRCEEGFLGDGYFCKKSVIGCNIINSCSKYADCLFDYEEHGYRCKCNAQRGFAGDGFACSPVKSCAERPALCDVNADCVKGGGGGAVCGCRDGFIGDGFGCEAIPTFEGDYLVLSHGMALMKVPFDATPAKKGVPIVVEPFQTATGVDADCLRGHLYWSDTTGRAVKRAGYDGSKPEVFLRGRGMGFPEDVAVDWLARNLYWTDSGKRTIEVASLEERAPGKTVVVTLVDEGLRNPRGIAVHPTVGRLFWTDWDRARPRIESSNLDGSDRSVLIDAFLGMPNGLTIDFDQGLLCWTDGGAAMTKIRPAVIPKIECADFNGGARRPIVELEQGARMPYGIALTKNYIFWSDWRRSGVHGAHRASGELLEQPLPHILESAAGRPFGLVSVSPECPDTAAVASTGGSAACQNPGNACAANQICAANGKGGRSCLCSDTAKRDPESDCQDIIT